MPPRKSITLTEAELRLMKMLWARGESAVGDLVAALPEGEALAYTSVLTTLRILEQKGYVRHHQEGRAFVYSTCVEEHEASRSEIRHMMQRFFGNSRERLLLSLLGDDEIDAEELRRLREAIGRAADDVDGVEEAAPGEVGRDAGRNADINAGTGSGNDRHAGMGADVGTEAGREDGRVLQAARAAGGTR